MQEGTGFDAVTVYSRRLFGTSDGMCMSCFPFVEDAYGMVHYQTKCYLETVIWCWPEGMDVSATLVAEPTSCALIPCLVQTFTGTSFFFVHDIADVPRTRQACDGSLREQGEECRDPLVSAASCWWQRFSFLLVPVVLVTSGGYVFVDILCYVITLFLSVNFWTSWFLSRTAVVCVAVGIPFNWR